MSSDELAGLPDLSAIRERLEREAGERTAATERTLRAAVRLQEAAEPAGLTGKGAAGNHPRAVRYYGLDVAAFRVSDPETEWKAQVCVIPAGWDRVITEAVHECREILAGDLLGRLRKIEQPDGTWPETAAAKVIRDWLLDHGVNADER